MIEESFTKMLRSWCECDTLDDMTNHTTQSDGRSPATYGDTRPATEIAQGQIASAFRIRTRQLHDGVITADEYAAFVSDLAAEADKRGVTVTGVNGPATPAMAAWLGEGWADSHLLAVRS